MGAEVFSNAALSVRCGEVLVCEAVQRGLGAGVVDSVRSMRKEVSWEGASEGGRMG